MHAYLLIGKGSPAIEEEIAKLLAKLAAERLDYEVAKIEDVRELQNFTKLAVTKPTAIIIKDIGSATEEALNAFLKSLEEPQELLYFILQAHSEAAVLPTILSRCRVIYLAKQKYKIDETKYDRFLSCTISEKFILLEKFKARDEAIVFLENLIVYLHHTIKSKPKTKSNYLKVAQKTLNSIKANGNINLQLTNFAIQLTRIIHLETA
ncbi:MAG: hypothetical protein UT61_C0045G0012 [Candidatus Woesebacteria bacterium GW2011_GWA1_39_8]|jgi:DNA polymerase III delta prime subunit|uniref:Polymerase III, delta prime subunit protein n=1 Tax=Candidatus Woesebacteria bacterium GW2011_GWA1_39_8 TaxID=1618552 RepID=A0A0G0PU65_9BACT|nr:MAG: hypothetical protein UT61_C0045G0012 [Candidatus Woesebacteria bacterium GW2011_GWA1_39_8]